MWKSEIFTFHGVMSTDQIFKVHQPPTVLHIDNAIFDDR